jgi:uncharacterized protein (DUF1778 family)
MAQLRKKHTKSRSLINLRVSSEDRRLIDRAATATGKNRPEFMLNAARFAAEEALLDKVLSRVDAKSYDGLMAYPADAGLRKLMRTTPPWQG